jgi:hypothetical protein
VKQAISSGKTSCASHDDVADGQAACCMPLKIEAVGQNVPQVFVQTFPESKLEAMLVRSSAD